MNCKKKCKNQYSEEISLLLRLKSIATALIILPHLLMTEIVAKSRLICAHLNSLMPSEILYWKKFSLYLYFLTLTTRMTPKKDKHS